MTEIDENKRIDEEWKKKVIEDKSRDVQEPVAESGLPEPDFNTFVYGLATQAMMALGQIENPLTKKKEVKLVEAKYLIDTLRMLQEKTKTNLTAVEAQNLETLLYNLQLAYVREAK
jgi:hypothetical protein